MSKRLSILVTLGLVILFGAACGSGRQDGSAIEQTTAPASAQAQPTEPAPITIVAMGDSLTEGFGLDDPGDAYPAQLERKLQADGYAVTVINAGNSGETSSGARSRVDWLLNLEPDIVILATGGNDGLRGIDPEVTQANLAEITARLQEAEVTIILAGMEMVQNMGEAYTSAFRAAYPAVSEQYDTLLVPFLLEGVAANPDLNQPDFIHPTAEGYAVVVETLYPYVLEALDSIER
jgi:acyl-CoA thioesterase-1